MREGGERKGGTLSSNSSSVLFELCELELITVLSLLSGSLKYKRGIIISAL